ncbi:MAG: hypothetical protein GF347_05590 [Candidatus Moranbacteria bacterium]|nr:hypothetical protein [Candidatus Moranbacteria bacterium]
MQKKQESPQSVEDFVDHLMELKGLTKLEPEIREQVKREIFARVKEFIYARMLEEMPKDKLDEFERLLEEGDQEKMIAFNEKHLPNLQDLITQSLIEFEKQYLDLK